MARLTTARVMVLAMLPMILTAQDANTSKALRGAEVCTIGVRVANY